MSTQGVEVTREFSCTLGKDNAKRLGTLDLRIRDLDSPDFSMGFGLRAADDKSLSIQFVAACRVIVCGKWAVSGSSSLKRKHTARLDLWAIVPGVVDQFFERAGLLRQDIGRMTNSRLTDGRAKEVLHVEFASGILPIRLFPIVSNFYFDDETQFETFPDRSLWSLNNEMTEAMKLLKPAPQPNCGHRASPAPIAVVDGIEVFN